MSIVPVQYSLVSNYQTCNVAGFLNDSCRTNVLSGKYRIDGSIPGNRLVQHPDGSIELMQKSIVEVFAEKVLLPLYKGIAALSQHSFIWLRGFLSGIDRLLNRIFNFFPFVEAAPAPVQKASPKSEDRFIVIHDNQMVDTPRLGVVNLEGRYWPVAVDKYCNDGKCEQPEMKMFDLESISRVPLKKNHFIACNSGNNRPEQPLCFYFNVRKQSAKNGDDQYTARVDGLLSLPVPEERSFDKLPVVVQLNKDEMSELVRKVNIEGFALGKKANHGDYKGQYIAIWAHRGIEKDPIVTWVMKGYVNLEKMIITPVEIKIITSPYDLRESKDKPVYKDSRPISDLFVTEDGTVLAISAMDRLDDEKPFRSRIYQLEGVGNLPKYRLDVKFEGLCYDSKGKIVAVSDNENIQPNLFKHPPLQGQPVSGGFICTGNLKSENNDCKCVMDCDPSYAMSGVAFLDPE